SEKNETPPARREEQLPPQSAQQSQPDRAETPITTKEKEPPTRPAETPTPEREERKKEEPKSEERPRTNTKQPKKGDDLPDVSLQIPEETRPEVKAILKANAISLSSRTAAERVKAAQVLGELGEQGKPARGLLCRAMLDPVTNVRVAAADA